jgi:hypothetical protein
MYNNCLSGNTTKLQKECYFSSNCRLLQCDGQALSRPGISELVSYYSLCTGIVVLCIYK